MGPGAAILTMFLSAEAGAAPSPAPDSPPLIPAPVDLRWEAPAGCPDAETIQAGIARGLPATPAPVAKMRAEVKVFQVDAEHWRAELDLRGPDWTATRTLKGPTCAAVSDAAGLVIVLALNTDRQEREVILVPPAPPPSPVGPPAAGTPFVSLGATTDVGALPAPSVGGTVAVGWRFARARLDLGASLLASRQGTVPDHPDTGATFRFASAGLRGCYLLGDRWAAGPCIAGGVNRTSGTGFGPITAGEATSTAGFFAAGILGEWRLSRWVVPYLAVEGAIPLVRPQFSVKDIGPVHRASAVSFRGVAGLELRFR
jgi:hypothetical protein